MSLQGEKHEIKNRAMTAFIVTNKKIKKWYYFYVHFLCQGSIQKKTPKPCLGEACDL